MFYSEYCSSSSIRMYFTSCYRYVCIRIHAKIRAAHITRSLSLSLFIYLIPSDARVKCRNFVGDIILIDGKAKIPSEWCSLVERTTKICAYTCVCLLRSPLLFSSIFLPYSFSSNYSNGPFPDDTSDDLLSIDLYITRRQK